MDAIARHKGAWLAGLLCGGVLLLAACGGGGAGGPLDFIRPDRYDVQNPSKTAARVTGTGCSGTEGGAQVEARDTALYNLRSVTGNADYQVRYRVLRIYPDDGRICADVEATAVK
jgi:hypothetical protein